MLAEALQEALPPPRRPLGMGGEAVAPRIGHAGELQPDLPHQPLRLVRSHLHPVPAENLGVDLSQTRTVDQGVSDVERDGADHLLRRITRDLSNPTPFRIRTPGSCLVTKIAIELFHEKFCVWMPRLRSADYSNLARRLGYSELPFQDG
jgi:hypothetical protein